MIDQISDNLYWIILLIIPILLYINYYSKPTKKKGLEYYSIKNNKKLSRLSRIHRGFSCFYPNTYY